MLLTCFSTAPSVTTSPAAIAPLERPSAISRSTSRSLRGQPLQRVLSTAADQQLADDLGVERRAARRHAAQGLDELADIRDPVLQQVADAAGVPGDQLDGVGLLDVLGQHQHRDLRPLSTQHQGGPDPLVGPGRRHPDIDDAQVGLVLLDRSDERLAVLDSGDDLEAGFGRAAARSLPAGGRRPRRSRLAWQLHSKGGRAAGRAGDGQGAVDRTHPVAQSGQAGARFEMGTADARRRRCRRSAGPRSAAR